MFAKIWQMITGSKKSGKTKREPVSKPKPTTPRVSSELASAYRKLAKSKTPKLMPQQATITVVTPEQRQKRLLPYPQWQKLVRSLFSGHELDGANIDGTLVLSRLRLRYLPDNLSIQGDLDLRQCQRLRKLGANLKVEGNLYIGGKAPKPWWWERWQKEIATTGEPDHLSRDRYCPLSALPPGMVIAKNLQIHDCDWLSELPGDLKVGGSLILAGCRRLKKLPDNLEIKGNMVLSGLKSLQALPQNIHVHKNLILMGVPISELPAGLRVEGGLYIQSCLRLSGLPDGLKVRGNLVIHRCLFQQLAEKMQIGANLRIARCPHLTNTPTELVVAGNVIISECNSLATITPGIEIGHDLLLLSCTSLTSLPDGLKVHGTLNLAGCSSLAQLPANLDLGSALAYNYPALYLRGCTALQHLPDDMKVNSSIDIADSGLQDLPDNLVRQVKIRWRGVTVDPDLIFRPEKLRPEQILGQHNSELRRVLIERVGVDKVLAKANAKILACDADPGGPRTLVSLRLPGQSRENMVYLVCRCPSSARQYMLRVPPNIISCHEAAAWIAGFENPDEYNPYQET